MSSIELENNNDELEEGEIAEDSNDACSLDDDDIDDLNSADLGSANRGSGAGGSLVNAGSAAAAEDDGGPQKKRKKVVRKVRRKIKVKKKVVRKKGNGNNGGGGNNTDNSINNNNNVDGNSNASRGTSTATTTITTTTTANRNDNSSIFNNNNQMSVTKFSNSGLNQPQLLQQQHHHHLHQQLLPITTTSSPMIMTPAPLLPHIQQPTLQPQHIDMNLIQHQQQLLNQHHNNPQQHQHLLPQLPMQQQNQPQPPPLLQHHLHQQQPQTMTSNPQASLDSLWEQQILMLQELQRQQADQQTQILRAAATDEDLRIFGPPLPQVTLPPGTVNNNINTSNNLTYQPLQQKPNTTTTTTSVLPNITNQPLNTITSKDANVMQLGTETNIKQSNHQTPSSPDDENGKSSYEAISKMLTLLRNSANVSDSLSEMNDGDTLRDNSIEQSVLDSKLKQQQQSRGAIEYSLIPILVDGIDYTKYKLLSQFEPKFKNDPRLNQQT